MTITEHLWQHLRDSIGFPRTTEYRHIPDLPELAEVKWNDEFWDRAYAAFVDFVYMARQPLSQEEARQVHLFEFYMRNRLILGTFRYRVWEGDRHSHDYPKKMADRIARFPGDGNLEHYVDTANFALVEYSLEAQRACTLKRMPIWDSKAGLSVVQIEQNIARYVQSQDRGYLLMIAAWSLVGFVFAHHPLRHFGASDGDIHPSDHPDGSRS